jgi:hypothetical protein
VSVYVLEFCHGDIPESTERLLIYAGDNKERCEEIANWCMKVIVQARASKDPHVSNKARTAYCVMKEWVGTDTNFRMADVLEQWSDS